MNKHHQPIPICSPSTSTFLGKMFKHLRLHLSLLINSPRGYLYSFTLPSDQFVSIKPYSPDVQRIAKQIIHQISSACPLLPVCFFGSSALAIDGLGDIDIFVECSAEYLSTYLPSFTALFGHYSNKEPQFVEWKFIRHGHSVDLTLIDPSHRNFRDSLLAFHLLESRPDLLNEYRQLKHAMNGKSLRAYNQETLHFFNRLHRLKSV